MLRLRSSILARLLSSSPASSPGSSFQRLLSAPASRITPSPSFAVEEYLVDSCGLSRAQALKAAAKLSHLKSPANPDAVLAFLAGLGLSGADVAALVSKDPRFLCAGVERTLAPVVVGLTGLGLPPSQVARLVSLAPASLRRRCAVSNLPYYLSLFGSCENVPRVLKNNSALLVYNFDGTVKPKLALLRECGLDDSDITKLCLSSPWLLTTNLERIRTMMACAEGIGVPRYSRMFRIALHAVAFLSKEKIAAKVDCLRNTFRWSDAEVRVAVRRAPMLLARSMGTLQSKSEFLISEVGLQPAYIAYRPIIVTYSLEGRLRPRYYVVKFLKENGLLKHDHYYYSALLPAEKVFMEKYICPHKEAAPHLAEDYADACRGQVPTRFRST